MMKIRNCLLLSISYFSLCSLAQANISEGEKEFIFTHTSKGVKQTSAASFGVIKYRGMKTATVLEHTHLLHLDSHSQLLSFRQISPLKRQKASLLELAEQDSRNLALTASVCFISDTKNCSGNIFSDTNSPDNSSGGTLGNGGSSGGDEWDNPFPPEEACRQLGYTLSSCNPGESPDDFCPADRSFFKKCTCTENCPKGYQKTPCGSGMLQTDVTITNCQTCYRCTACQDDCPQGYDTSMGICNEISTYQTECGNICYKIISNECSDGSLTAPQETENQKNKIVGYTDCGNPCFKSFDDTCPSGYDKIPAAAEKCYDTAITSFGSTCRKEKTCSSTCNIGDLYYSDDTCSTELIANKTLLGVVVYNDGITGWAMTLAPISTGDQWGKYGVKTEITDKSVNSSCSNTSKLVALAEQYSTNTNKYYEAAITANQYNLGNRRWCLPAYDIFQNILKHYNSINNGIKTGQGEAFDVSRYYTYIYWSSTESSEKSAYGGNLKKKEISENIKSYADYDGSVMSTTKNVTCPVTCFGTDTSACN